MHVGQSTERSPKPNRATSKPKKLGRTFYTQGSRTPSDNTNAECKELKELTQNERFNFLKKKVDVSIV